MICILWLFSYEYVASILTLWWQLWNTWVWRSRGYLRSEEQTSLLVMLRTRVNEDQVKWIYAHSQPCRMLLSSLPNLQDAYVVDRSLLPIKSRRAKLISDEYPEVRKLFNVLVGLRFCNNCISPFHWIWGLSYLLGVGILWELLFCSLLLSFSTVIELCYVLYVCQWFTDFLQLIFPRRFVECFHNEVKIHTIQKLYTSY